MAFFDRITGTEKQVQALYDLLQRRDHSISHQVLPPFDVHLRFVVNHPYSAWYLIYDQDQAVGSFYLKADNSIGMNLLINDACLVLEVIDFIKQNHQPQPAVPSMVPPYFYINVSASNTEAQNAMTAAGLIPLQISYKIR